MVSLGGLRKSENRNGFFKKKKGKKQIQWIAQGVSGNKLYCNSIEQLSSFNVLLTQFIIAHYLLL
jgi:hypothetical protein